MTITTLVQNPRAKWLAGFGVWTLIGLSFASQFYIYSAKAGLEVTWRQAVGFSLADWYVFALLSIPVMHLTRRFRFDAAGWPRSLALHTVASLGFSLAYMVLRAGIGQWQTSGTFGDTFRTLLVKTWHFNLLVYWVILAVTSAFDYNRRLRERELRAAELEKRLAQAKLQSLQMQLNPHFLFNTLHSISALMHMNVEAADRMIAQLSDLLRAALAGSDTQEVPLRQELQFLERYLQIEKTRFGDRLTVQMEIAPDTLTARVPNLILQPLVENAIKHGIEPRARPGRIVIRAARQGEQVVLEVADNGDGIKGASPQREGVGLSNSRARLRELYGVAHAFELGNGPGGGFLAKLTIPWRTGTIEHENKNGDRR